MKAVICRSHGGFSANEKEGKNALHDNFVYYSILSYIHVPAVHIYWHHKWLQKVPLRKIFEKISCVVNNDTIVINITTNVLTKLHQPKIP